MKVAFSLLCLDLISMNLGQTFDDILIVIFSTALYALIEKVRFSFNNLKDDETIMGAK